MLALFALSIKIPTVIIYSGLLLIHHSFFILLNSYGSTFTPHGVISINF